MASLAGVTKVVDQSLQTAYRAATALFETRSKAASMLADLPRYAELSLGSAEEAWVATLFVDLRESTKRAARIGPLRTYLTMHALLPALAFLAAEEGGYIVGFRGDGLFAAFGLRQDGKNPPELDKRRTVLRAAVCGQQMLEAVSEVINPALEVEPYRVPGDLRIGVGIDCGEIIVTRIGLPGGYEITAYGDSVNNAAKLSGVDGGLLLSDLACKLYPSNPGGQVTFEGSWAGSNHGYRPRFPSPQLV